MNFIELQPNIAEILIQTFLVFPNTKKSVRVSVTITLVLTKPFTDKLPATNVLDVNLLF